jgi:hypothetical protein
MRPKKSKKVPTQVKVVVAVTVASNGGWEAQGSSNVKLTDSEGDTRNNISIIADDDNFQTTHLEVTLPVPKSSAAGKPVKPSKVTAKPVRPARDLGE